MENVIHKTAKYVFGFFTALILFLCLFFEGQDYFAKKDFLWSNLGILLFLSVVFLIVLVAYIFYLKKGVNLKLKVKLPPTDYLIAFFSIVLFFVQCVICYNIFFLAGWDPYYIRTSASHIVENSPQLSVYDIYYSMYPNNKALVLLAATLLKFNNVLGVFTGEYETFIFVILNCLINSFACYITYKTLKLFVSRRYAALGFLLCVLVFGLSPWSVVFYSDSVSLFIPVLCLYLYKKPAANKILRRICRLSAIAIGIAGFFIKPQCLILVISIFIVETAAIFKNFSLKKLKRYVCLLLCAVLCFAVFSGIINSGAKKSGIEIDSGKKMGAWHFVMMGLNGETNGAYIEEDVTFSKQFDTTEQRRVANIDEIKQRLKEMGIKGYFEHTAKKMLTTFNDGTFAWNEEGTFYFVEVQTPDTNLSYFLKSFYHINGYRHAGFLLISQIIWILTLILSFFSCFRNFQKAQKNTMSVLWICILGLVLFEILFEARARYLYIYAPVFCITAIIGLKNICQRLKNILKRENEDL